MPTVKLNRKEVESLLNKKVALEVLKDRISMIGTDLEEINDTEIVVEIFPNRPDMLSEQGFARALSAFMDIKPGLKDYKVKKSSYKVEIDKSVSNVRPNTVCAVVKNLKLDDEKIKSLIQIQEKLHVSYGRNRRKAAIGIYPLEKIKFPIKFLALPPEKIIFRPLESEKRVSAVEILKNHPTGREFAHLLKDHSLYPVFIDANTEILSMPPIINSYNTGKVTESTKDVFIECSGFSLETLNKTLNILVTALADMGGEIYGVTVVKNSKKEITPNLNPEVMSINKDYVNKILGLNLKDNEIKKLLERMGYGIKGKKVLVPRYRTDILHEIDLVEDIGIAYGYENLKSVIPNVFTIAGESSEFKDKIAEILIGLNLLETSTFHLTSEENSNKKMNLNNKTVKVMNSINQDYNTLRPSILSSLLQVLSENTHHEYPQKLFEVSEVFELNKEKSNLGIVLANNLTTFTEIKQVLDSLFLNLGKEFGLESYDHPSFINGRCGKIIFNKKEIGFLGEIHPQVLENFKIEVPVSALEINVDSLF